MLQGFFHAWERRLAAATTDRVVRPFDWGLDWIPQNGHHTTTDPADRLGHWISEVMVDSDAFFTPSPTTDYTLTPRPEGDLLTFPSAFTTPHDENNTVYARYLPARSARLKPRAPSAPERDAGTRGARSSPVGARGSPVEARGSPVGARGSPVGARGSPVGARGFSRAAAVLVLPQWNSDPNGHVGL